MKKVLLVHYSQTGQLEGLAGHFLAPLRAAGEIEVDVLPIEPQQPFTFPWRFWTFFDTFPETVHLKPRAIVLPQFSHKDYDVVVLAYTVWFLSPSQPLTAFLQHPDVCGMLRGKKVITLTGCRNMWLTAHQTVKKLLAAAGAELVGNIVKTDNCGSAASFITTPAWMLTGDKQYFKSLPPAGILEVEAADCSRFGAHLADVLRQDGILDETLFRHMNAAPVDEKLMFSELAAIRSFRAWGRLLMAAGKISPLLRRVLLAVYIVFLIAMILTVVPFSAVLKRLLMPLMKEKVAAKRAELSAPSGS